MHRLDQVYRAPAWAVVLIVSIVGWSLAHAAYFQMGGAHAAALIAGAEQHGYVRIIVTLKTVQNQSEVIAQLPRAMLPTLRRFDRLPLLALDADAPTLRALARNPLVQEISQDALLAPADLASNAVIGAPAAWAAGYDGTGWEVAVLDTGIQATHPFLAGKVVAEACFSTTNVDATTVCPNGQSTSGGQPAQVGAGSGVNCPTSVAGCAHGTHAAGVIAGRNYVGGPGYDGVARSARLIAIQVYSQIKSSAICGNFPPCARAYTSDVIAALQYVQSLATSRSIAGVSLALAGDTAITGACDTNPIKPVIDGLRALGIATIVPAGNAAMAGLSVPACVSSAISIGATDNNDSIASFSNRSRMLRLYAPGVAIGSSVPGNTFSLKSGTSTAAASAAGAWAVLRQRYPTAAVDDLLALFQTTGVPITNGGFTVARVKLDAAVATLPTATPMPTSMATAQPIYVPLTQK